MAYTDSFGFRRFPINGQLGRPAVLVAVFLAGFSMRAPLVAAMPVLEILRVDLKTDRAVVGLLTTLPVLLMGIIAPLAPRISRRLRLEVGLALVMVCIAASAAARLWGGLATLLVTSVVLGIAISIGQPFVMGFTKAQYAQRVAVIVGVYAAGINLGAAVAARVALPIYELTGDWRMSLALWFVPALATGAVWWMLPTRSGPTRWERSSVGVWRLGKAWIIAVFFSVTVLVYYSVLTWLAPLLVDKGWDADQAGLFLSYFALFQLPATLLFPWLASRTETYCPWLVLTIALTIIGLIFAVGEALSPWFTVIALGLGAGGLFPLCLALPVVNARDAHAAASLSAMAFAVGYSAGAMGPALVGWLRDATGSFVTPFLALSMLSALQLSVVRRVVPRKRSAHADL